MRTLSWAIVVLPLIQVSTSSRCGPNFGLTCEGSKTGNCCSQYSYCGFTSAYCGKGCQSGYGDCTPSTPQPAAVSTDGTCGGSKGFTCLGSEDGDCCSQYNWCGKTNEYCGSGCNPLFGSCTSPSSPKPAAVSTDGTCGGSKGFTCLGSEDGDCCSQYNWCGKTNEYCGTGCNPLFGSCNPSSSTRISSTSSRTFTTSVRTSSSSTRTSSSTVPSSTLKVSTNGRCGNANNAAPAGMTCLGSRWGDCCSQWSFCGSTGEYCGTGCQSGFGACKPVSSSSSRASTSTSSSISSSPSQPSSSPSGLPLAATPPSPPSASSSSSSSSSASSSSSLAPSSSASSSSSSIASSSSSVASSSSSSDIPSSTSSVPSSTTSAPTTPSLVCGVPGGRFIAAPPVVINTFFRTLDDCRNLCASSLNGCQSYVFIPDLGGCVGYTKPISQLGPSIDPTDRVYYDLGCGTAATSSSGSSSAPSPTSSSTVSSPSSPAVTSSLSSTISSSSSAPTATSSAPALTCGVIGDFTNRSYILSPINILENVIEPSICGPFCLQYSNCNSYIYLSNHGRCEFFQMTLAEAGFYPMASYPRFYERGCALLAP